MRKFISAMLSIAIIMALAMPALAVDNYHFQNESTEEFYQTGVTTVTYDGEIPGYIQNIYDFTPQTIYDSSFGATIIAPELDEGYGLGSQKPANAPGGSSGGSAPANAPTSAAPTNGSSAGAVLYPDAPGNSTQTAPQYKLTPVEDVRKTDGSIGVLKIPKIKLTVTAYDGDTFTAMKKGVGHIASSSCWTSNVALVGHNRGVNDYFGKLKDLTVGDEMTYSTTLGTRTYTVVFVGKIANNDWSKLEYTTDNRLTLITCVADQPQYRLCIQAVEKR